MSLEFIIKTSNSSSPLPITFEDKPSYQYLKKKILKNISLGNDEEIIQISINYNGKDIIIADDMGVIFLFDKVKKEEIKQGELFLKIEKKKEEKIKKEKNKNENPENGVHHELIFDEKQDFEDKIDYLLIQMKEKIMKEMKNDSKNKKMVYRGKECNKCKKHIIGYLYQCSECENNRYYLCSNCIEENLNKPFHEHKFYIL